MSSSKFFLSAITGLLILATISSPAALADTNPCSGLDAAIGTSDEKLQQLLKQPYDVIPFLQKKMNTVSFLYPCSWQAADLVVGTSTVMAPLFDNRQYLPLQGAHLWVYDETTINPDLNSDALDALFVRNSNLSLDGNTYIPSFKLLDKKDATMLGKPGREYTYTGEVSSIEVKAVQTQVSIGKHIYAVVFAASKPEYFVSDYPAYTRVVKSMELIAASSSSARPINAKNASSIISAAVASQMSAAKVTRSSSSSKSSAPSKWSTLKVINPRAKDCGTGNGLLGAFFDQKNVVVYQCVNKALANCKAITVTGTFQGKPQAVNSIQSVPGVGCVLAAHEEANPTFNQPARDIFCQLSSDAKKKLLDKTLRTGSSPNTDFNIFNRFNASLLQMFVSKDHTFALPTSGSFDSCVISEY